MRYTTSDGTFSSTSAKARSFPPELPVMASTRMPSARATFAAASTFAELPDVENAHSTSPSFPSALTSCAKSISSLQSFKNAVL